MQESNFKILHKVFKYNIKHFGSWSLCNLMVEIIHTSLFYVFCMES